MKLSEVCIKRPVLAWVFTLILILVGVVAGLRLPIQQYPKSATERPFITIETQLDGAGAEIIENTVTTPIEEAMAGIEGIEAMSSISSSEDSKVMLEFSQDRALDSATNDVRDRLSRNRNRLPEGVTEPTLVKSKADERPIMGVAITSPSMTTGELHDFAKRELEKNFESLPGVARVDILGAGDYKMRLYLDPVKMIAHHVTVAEVIQSVKRQNVERPAGKIVSKNREFQVTTVANLEKAEEFQELIISTKGGRPVRMKDIGEAKLNADDKKTKSRYNGSSAVSISILKQSNTNPIDVAKVVKIEIEKIKKILPETMKIDISFDSTTFIEQSIEEVYKTIGEAVFLVILVVFLFLRSARASLIPLVTIPVSLIGSLFLMYVLGFSINIFTLMALVLAIGLVVDDAIVVLENVYRYIEKGETPFNAAFKGISEISFAVVAMTLTLAAVYTPVALAKGMTGKLLAEFAITLAGAVMISGFVALTLSPMMCARMLSAESHAIDLSTTSLWKKFKQLIRTDILLDWLEDWYESTLDRLLRTRRFMLVVVAVLFAALGGIVFVYLPSEMAPREDRGMISVDGSAPQTATREFTDRYVEIIDKIIEGIPEVERRVLSINNPTFDASIQLKPDRQRKTQEVADELKKVLYNDVIGVEVTRVDSGGSGLGGNPVIEFVIRANKGYRELKEITGQFIQALHASGYVAGVTSEAHGDTQDYVINILRNKTSELEINAMDISDSIEALIRGKNVGKFKKDNRLYDVHVQIDPEAGTDPTVITNLYVQSGIRRKDKQEEFLVPLSEVLTIHSRSGPKQIHRQNRMRAVSIYAFLKPAYSVGEGIKKIDEIASDVIPRDTRLEYTGETKRFLKESGTMLLVFGLALCFIYFVMAAQFESWRDPLVIMLSVPLSLAGALVTLGLVADGSLNLYSNIGLVTLIGLITKHGILMVEFANSLRDCEKMEKLEAIVRACKFRLRPILMTTFAMVLGAIPLALATGAGSEGRRQIGWTIVGGMGLGTLFTLFVIPAFYLYISANKRKSVVLHKIA